MSFKFILFYFVAKLQISLLSIYTALQVHCTIPELMKLNSSNSSMPTLTVGIGHFLSDRLTDIGQSWFLKSGGVKFSTWIIYTEIRNQKIS